uniref:F-box protein 2 n=1 Tax=Xenopus tropicalis TaxID=8364 RepID=A0A6I8SN42_XENTR
MCSSGILLFRALVHGEINDILIRILSEIPAEELVLVCRLVCSQWKNIIDGLDFWQTKCMQDCFMETELEKEPINWKTVYFLNKRKRNLLKNNSGEGKKSFAISLLDLNYGGDGWKIEDLPGDNGNDFPFEGIKKYFATSFEWCSKSQLIDLLSEGYWEDLLDTDQPNILIEDWYAARSDSGCLYELCVQLLSDNKDIITEYKSEIITIPQFSDASWNQINHTFSGYGPGVRFIRFQHGGQDSVFWKGWYGVRVTNSSPISRRLPHSLTN